MGFVKALLSLPLVFIILVFAFVNNDMATFSLWPTGVEITISLSVAIVFLVILGYIIGWFFTWLSYSQVRAALRNQKKQNKKLYKEQEKLTKEVEGLQGNIESLKASVSVQEEVKTSWKNNLKKAFGFKSDSSAK